MGDNRNRAAARREVVSLVEGGESSPGWFRARLDGWFNLLTGLGTSRDKTRATEFEADPVLMPEEMESLFHFNDLANTIVSAIPAEAMRQGFAVIRSTQEDDGTEDADVADVSDDTAVLAKRLEALGVASKVQEAWTWGRCFGGGAILLGAEGAGPPETPLEDEKVTAVRFLTVLDRRDLLPDTYYSDPMEDKYGQVKTYRLQPTGVNGTTPALGLNTVVHESRLVMFGGALTSRRERARNQNWDHSVLQRVHTVLQDCGQNWSSVVAMMADMSQSVFKIRGLIDSIAEGGQKDLADRMALVDSLRSVTRSVLLDAEGEDFQNVERSAVTGVDTLLDKTFLRVAAAARMPVTILMGQAPAGLNATGAIDLRWWYDSVRAGQEKACRPNLERIVRLVARVEIPGEDPEVWHVDFPSLWQMTPTEEAAYRKAVADADGVWIDKQVILPEEVAISRFGGREFNGRRYIVDMDARRKALETDLDKLAEGTPEPPATPPPGQPPGPQGPQDTPASPTPPPPKAEPPKTPAPAL